MKKIKVTIWNEFIREKSQKEIGERIRSIYPNGIHRAIAEHLKSEDLEIRCVSLDEPEQGLPDSLLNDTDVLLWWGHTAHDRVADALVEKIALRIQYGMGLIVLHSGHYSKIFRRMMGTECRLHWRDVGEKERLWCVCPSHPIVQGVPESFVIPNSEMYGECFDLPDDGKIVYMSWYEGGNVLRSGVTFQRGAGKIFYFSPGHESYPIYHDPNIIKVISNAVRWASPTQMLPPRVTPQKISLEKISTPNPHAMVDTTSLHR
ncbi:MAG: ThuA domain-containing protein [Lentisphaeria bacterium]